MKTVRSFSLTFVSLSDIFSPAAEVNKPTTILEPLSLNAGFLCASVKSKKCRVGRKQQRSQAEAEMNVQFPVTTAA